MAPTPINPAGSDWYINLRTGEVRQIDNPQQVQSLDPLTWVGPTDHLSAEALGSNAGAAGRRDLLNSLAGGTAPPGIVPQVTPTLPPAGSSGGANWSHLMIRTGEFVVGGMLLIGGINAFLRKNTVYQEAAKAAKAVTKRKVI